MATTRQRSKPSPNGAGAPVRAAVKEASDTASTLGRKARGPLMAAGAAAAGLAGGWAIGSRHGSRRGNRLQRTVELLRDGAKHLDSTTGQLSGTAEDVREFREQLEKVNNRSPLEVVLDGLTHRRGVHRRRRRS